MSVAKAEKTTILEKGGKTMSLGAGRFVRSGKDQFVNIEHMAKVEFKDEFAEVHTVGMPLDKRGFLLFGVEVQNLKNLMFNLTKGQEVGTN
jgi:hypothetical protein